MPSSSLDRSALIRAVRNPATTAFAVLLAIALGLTRAPMLQWMRPVGTFYLALLQMFTLPFLVVTVPLAVRTAMTSGTAGPDLRRLAIWAILASAGVAASATLAPLLIFHLSSVDESTLARIGRFVGAPSNRIDLEFALDPNLAPAPLTTSASHLASFVPANIFAALSGDDSLRVLVFCAIFGVALVLTEHHQEHSAFASLRHIQRVCVLVFDWLSLLVPLGVVVLIAPLVASMGSEVLAVVELLAWGFLLASVIVLAGAVVVMATSLRQSPSMVLSQLLRPMMLAAATTNSLVCIPASLEAMTDGLRAARQPCNLFIPVGFATIRFGTVIYFTVTTMFMALLTGRRLSLLDLIAVPALSFAASFATLGAAGLAALGPLATVLRSFGLSYELALPLLVVIDPVANMIRTVLNVTVNCAIPALAGGRGTETPAPDPAVDMVTT